MPNAPPIFIKMRFAFIESSKMIFANISHHKFFTMKKTLLFFNLLSLLLAFGSLNAQNCTYDVNKIDEFEKVKIVFTSPVKVMYPTVSFPVVYMSLGKIDTNYVLKLNFSMNKQICFNSQDNELLLITDKEDVIRLKRSSDKVECTPSIKAGLYSGDILYALDRKTLLELQSRELRKARLYTSDSYIEFDMTEKNMNKKKAKSFFAQTVPCILNL